MKRLIIMSLAMLGFAIGTLGCSHGNSKNPLLEELKNQAGSGASMNKTGYTEIFYDDFDGNNLDDSKWEKCPEWERQEHMARHGWWNDDCSSVKDGCLVLECKKNENGKLISGGIRSRRKNNEDLFKNSKGLYEIKFKVEKGSGFWYAFWLFADNTPQNIGNGARNGAELDCFEILPNDNHMMTTIHWDAYGNEHKMKGTDGIDVMKFDSNFYDKWHVFQFEWTETSYICYLDGKHLWTMSGQEYGEGICQVDGYLKITTEFGEWGGPIDSVIQNGGSRKMLVDYVKVYKKN